ncbi:MAG: hypothetical protein ABIR18_03405 [Chitinophagaceae bacterium]
MRDTKPLLIALLSIGLVGTWVYHLYDKTQYSRQIKEVYVRDSVGIANAIRDSLKQRYDVTIDSMDSELNVTQTGRDSLKNQLGINLGEINHLKNQINTILKNRTMSKEDVILARSKINELQLKVDELSGTNSSITEEKSRLAAQMEQLTVQINGLQQNVKSLSDQNQTLSEQVRLASVFVASEMNLNAIDEKSNKEEETAVAKKADKFVASFVVQNQVNEFSNAEVIIVVLQPDGKVLEISDWNTGNFETKLQGMKSYTRLVKFDYTKGEQKQIIFSLNPADFQKGTYKLQVWHKGIMIGQTNKTLG